LLSLTVLHLCRGFLSDLPPHPFFSRKGSTFGIRKGSPGLVPSPPTGFQGFPPFFVGTWIRLFPPPLFTPPVPSEPHLFFFPISAAKIFLFPPCIPRGPPFFSYLGNTSPQLIGPLSSVVPFSAKALGIFPPLFSPEILGRFLTFQTFSLRAWAFVFFCSNFS